MKRPKDSSSMHTSTEPADPRNHTTTHTPARTHCHSTARRTTTQHLIRGTKHAETPNVTEQLPLGADKNTEGQEATTNGQNAQICDCRQSRDNFEVAKPHARLTISPQQRSPPNEHTDSHISDHGTTANSGNSHKGDCGSLVRGLGPTGAIRSRGPKCLQGG